MKVRGVLSINLGGLTIAYSPLDIVVTSWLDGGIYHFEFGDKLGYPEDMRVEDVGLGGMIIALPKRRPPNKTWELHATVDPDTLRHLYEDTTCGVVSM
jgi:hypothetical protein